MKNSFWRALPCIAVVLFLTSCGAILEEAAEQALEQGGVEIELDDVEDGEFSVTLEGEDGEETTIDVDGEEGTVDFESEDGEGTLTFDSELADGWPDDFPLPNDVTVVTSLAVEEAEQSVFNATFTGPAGSLDRYIEHFLGFDAEVVNQATVNSGGGEQFSIQWGTEEQPFGTLTLVEAEDEVVGQIALQLEK